MFNNEIVTDSGKTPATARTGKENDPGQARATALQSYLLAVHGGRAVITELALPLDCQNMIPYSDVPVGSSSGLYLLHEEPGYNLDVKAQGFYDVEDSALITTDVSVRADDVSF
jgi:hypothetical protein